MLQSKKALQAKPDLCVSAPFILALLFVFVVATRWPLAPRYLYYLDAPTSRSPWSTSILPGTSRSLPGYPLFVLLIRAIRVWCTPRRKSCSYQAW
jgi:hypothetical protein